MTSRMPSIVSLAVLCAVTTGAGQAPQAGRGRGPLTPEQQEAQKARQAASAPDAPRPIDALDSVWIEERTWMETRDAIRAGKTTAIIGSGGNEQNGPYAPNGKHNEEDKWSFNYLKTLGILQTPDVQSATRYDIHDDYHYEALVALVDPKLIRPEQRMKAKKFSINGVEMESIAKVVANGKKLVDYRARLTAAAIRKAIAASRVTQQSKPRRLRIPGVFEGGATPPGGMPRPGIMSRTTGTGH